MRYPRENWDDISIVICGEAGQGIQTVEEILVKAAKRSGFHVFSVKEFMSRIRGGTNSTSIRIGSDTVRAPVKRIDIAVPLSDDAIGHIRWRMDEGTTILLDPDLSGRPDEDVPVTILEVTLKKKAEKIGGTIYQNIISAGLISSLVGVERSVIDGIVEDRFESSSEEVRKNNRKALEEGYGMGLEIFGSGGMETALKPDEEVKKKIAVKGVHSISLGAISGGCDFIASYPMSPSTGVLVDLAERQHEFGIIAEQAEDEISAINMGLGAWYAGGRAMVTTSGGGFSLMSEGLSLAGMMELPMVIHLAQRPGPATGLPTRTEQGDLFLTLFSGHGEFPRVVFAPGGPEQSFDLAWRAFDIADRFQIPVILLTDQFLVDSYTDIDRKEFELRVPLRHIIKTDTDYLRYRFSMEGISDRGIPGYGEGLVNVDSDEHDEAGHITESMTTRTLMVEKRMAKWEALKKESIEPQLIGPGKGDVVICWGSTLEIVKEAVGSIGQDVSILHFSQIYPLHPGIGDILGGFKRKICLENNFTGQFARLLRMETGVEMDHLMLKVTGLPFTVEEVAESLRKYLHQDGGDR